MKAKRKAEVIVETLEKITIRFRNRGERRYCSSCGKPTTWLTEDEAREIFDTDTMPIDSVHPTDAGTTRMICAESIVAQEDEQNKKD